MSTVRVLDFRNRGVLETAEAIRDLFKDADLSQIEELRMSGSTVGPSAGQELGMFIKKMPALKVAHLRDLIATRLIDEVPIVISSVCGALLECKELVEVDLSNNAFGSRVAPLLVPLLSQHTSIQVLKLNNNGFGPEAGNIVAGALLEAAKRAESLNQEPNLRLLICGRNRLEDDSAALWGKVISANKNLQKVKMVNNGWREDGFKAIAEGLRDCPDLRHLSLRDSTSHNFSDTSEDTRGWHIIADVVHGARNLEFLDLSDTNLTGDGSSELIQALTEVAHPDLHTILLANNDMDGSHYEALKPVLSSHLPALTLLDLSLNEDVEDNEVVASMAELLEGRGGQLLITDEDIEEMDLEKDALDPEKETRFLKAPTLISETTKPEPEVDELADLMSSGLKI